jgi:alpha-2-macroglobulin
MPDAVHRSRRLALLAALPLTLLLAAGAAQAVKVASVSPQGEVAQVRQVVLKFSDAVLPLGDLRQPEPASLACQGPAGKGSARWIDERTWGYDFAQPLPPGVACVLKLKPAWQPLQGPLEGAREFRFSTGGPAVEKIEPGEGRTIAEDQHFLVRLNGAALAQTVTARASCEVQGIGERMGVRIVEGAARAAVLKARRIVDPHDVERTLLLTCQRPLPAGAKLRLVWGAGIAAVAAPKVVTRAPRRFEYEVRERFNAEFRCERERANTPCMPLATMSLRFSSPVARALAAQVRLTPAGGAPIAPFFSADDHSQDTYEVVFNAPLPPNTRFTISVPETLRDDAGRDLANRASFPLAVATAAMPPLAKFASSPFGIVEAGPDAALPITLRHVQDELRAPPSAGRLRIKRIEGDDDVPLMRWLAAMREDASQQRESRKTGLLAKEPGVRELKLPPPPSSAGGAAPPAASSEVVGLPLPDRGLHVVEIESAQLGAALLQPPAPMFVRTAVLATGLGVHFKHGGTSSLVWVTTLDRATPVSGASVRISDCTGKPLWNGHTDAQGLASVAVPLVINDTGDCIGERGLFVTARLTASTNGQPEDMAFVYSSWDRGIETWRFNFPTGGGEGSPPPVHTVFDRTLLRAGETVSMKHFLRKATAAGLAWADESTWPQQLTITHTGSGDVFKLPLQWRKGGRSASSSWAIPPAAKLGSYEVALVNGDRSWTSGQFRVEAFRLPLVDARLAAPKGPVVAPKSVALAAQLTYLSGGAVSGSALELSASLRDRVPTWGGFDEFSFAPPAQAPPEGATDDDDDDTPRGDGLRIVADRLPLRTDAQGAATATVPGLPALTGPAELQAELTFADPNGEVQTVSQRVNLWPAAVVAGVRARSWVAARGRVALQAVVLDTAGQPLAGRAISVIGRSTRTISSRQRLVGGFYGYDNRQEVKPLGTLCEGRTDARGRFDCDAMVAATGELELIAQASDDEGRASQAATTVWIAGDGEWWFAQDNDDRIDLLPEKREWQPGETARLQVRMPFRQATALVTVEREGVIDARVVTLRGDQPVIDVPIPEAAAPAPKAATSAGGDAIPSWAPNVYVSALVLRGRLREVPWYSFFSWGWRSPLDWWNAWRHESPDFRAPTSTIDLGRPAFKLGTAELRIGNAAHRLDVTVAADKPQYQVRQTAQTLVTVSYQGKPMAGAEVAFAAVDESLLALKDNSSWDLLAAMFEPRPWGVTTATAQNEIIGKRHFGRKAVPAGGGGGRNPTRELFDTLLVWKDVVTLDAKGQARIAVPLNDSLTSFRLVAIADAGTDRFGSGSTSVRVTQDLQMLSGLPPVAREGDRFPAVLTLRNTTSRVMNVSATLKATVNTDAPGARSGAPAIVRQPLTFASQTLKLAPNAAAEVQWPVVVPAGAFSLRWEAAVQEAGNAADRARDALAFTQLVQPAVPVRVLQSTIRPLEAPLEIVMAAPADAVSPMPGAPPSGGVQIGLQASLSGALPGLKRYFETYPFSCLEQNVSVALGLNDAKRWEVVTTQLSTYLDRDGLANYFPPDGAAAARGSDRLTAYVLSATHEAGFVLPDGPRDAMLKGLVAFVEGRIQRSTWAPRADGDARRLAAIDALARYGRAEPRMIGTVQWRPNDWPTASLLDAWSILKRLPAMPQHDERLAQVQTILRARLDVSGSTLRFSTEDSDFWWWLMDGPDANAARLILTVLDDPQWKDELPRLVTGTLGRQHRGAWLTTTANLWGALALQKFGRAFEATPVAGRSVAEIGGASFAYPWPAAAASSAAAPATGLLSWPSKPAPLKVSHEGSGRPWLTVQALAAIPLKAPLSAGYRISRSISAVQQKVPGRWSRGDVMRVKLEVDAQADGAWVVVADPVPTGATLLGSGLGRDAALATRGERSRGSGWLAFEERGFDVYRRYYETLPRGRHSFEYTLRLNTPGQFVLPPSRVEAMYAPDRFGEIPNAALEVAP